jgi:hypothetical protein
MQVFILFDSRDKSKASSQRDMCLKQITDSKKFVPQVSFALRGCAVRKSPGAGEPPTNSQEKKEKEKHTSRTQPETLAVAPRGKTLHFRRLIRLPGNPRIHPRGIR